MLAPRALIARRPAITSAKRVERIERGAIDEQARARMEAGELLHHLREPRPRRGQRTLAARMQRHRHPIDVLSRAIEAVMHLAIEAAALLLQQLLERIAV